MARMLPLALGVTTLVLLAGGAAWALRAGGPRRETPFVVRPFPVTEGGRSVSS